MLSKFLTIVIIYYFSYFLSEVVFYWATYFLKIAFPFLFYKHVFVMIIVIPHKPPTGNTEIQVLRMVSCHLLYIPSTSRGREPPRRPTCTGWMGWVLEWARMQAKVLLLYVYLRTLGQNRKEMRDSAMWSCGGEQLGRRYMPWKCQECAWQIGRRPSGQSIQSWVTAGWGNRRSAPKGDHTGPRGPVRTLALFQERGKPLAIFQQKNDWSGCTVCLDMHQIFDDYIFFP